jgi:hypothetical protein
MIVEVEHMNRDIRQEGRPRERNQMIVEVEHMNRDIRQEGRQKGKEPNDSRG